MRFTHRDRRPTFSDARESRVRACAPARAAEQNIRRGNRMNLTNDSYLIKIGTKNFTERYYRDRKGWLKVSARGRKFRMTAEQVLNHLLPAVAGVKPNLILTVEHGARRARRRTASRRPAAAAARPEPS
jgi:hypothetical protein